MLRHNNIVTFTAVLNLSLSCAMSLDRHALTIDRDGYLLYVDKGKRLHLFSPGLERLAAIGQLESKSDETSGSTEQRIWFDDDKGLLYITEFGQLHVFAIKLPSDAI